MKRLLTTWLNLRKLTSKNCVRRENAARSLAESGQIHAILRRLQKFRKAKPEVRANIIRELAKLKNAEAVPLLIQELGYPAVKSAAAYALIAIGGSRAEAAVIGEVRRGQNFCHALKVVSSQEATDALIEALRKRGKEFRKDAASALLSHGLQGLTAILEEDQEIWAHSLADYHPDQVENLFEILTNNQIGPQVRGRAAFHLSELSSYRKLDGHDLDRFDRFERVEEALCIALQDPNPEMRLQTCNSIESAALSLHQRDSLMGSLWVSLLNVLSDDVPEVSSAALRAFLGLITIPHDRGRSFQGFLSALRRNDSENLIESACRSISDIVYDEEGELIPDGWIALGALGDPRAAPRIVELMLEPGLTDLKVSSLEFILERNAGLTEEGVLGEILALPEGIKWSEEIGGGYDPDRFFAFLSKVKENAVEELAKREVVRHYEYNKSQYIYI